MSRTSFCRPRTLLFFAANATSCAQERDAIYDLRGSPRRAARDHRLLIRRIARPLVQERAASRTSKFETIKIARTGKFALWYLRSVRLLPNRYRNHSRQIGARLAGSCASFRYVYVGREMDFIAFRSVEPAKYGNDLRSLAKSKLPWIYEWVSRHFCLFSPLRLSLLLFLSVCLYLYLALPLPASFLRTPD